MKAAINVSIFLKLNKLTTYSRKAVSQIDAYCSYPTRYTCKSLHTYIYNIVGRLLSSGKVSAETITHCQGKFSQGKEKILHSSETTCGETAF